MDFVFTELSTIYAEQIDFYKVKNKEILEQFKIKALPCLLFIPLKAQPQIDKGAISPADLIKTIETVLNVKLNNARINELIHTWYLLTIIVLKILMHLKMKNLKVL